MSAYFILTQTVTDLERFRQDYLPKVMPILMRHNAEVIIADLEAEPLEGRLSGVERSYQRRGPNRRL